MTSRRYENNSGRDTRASYSGRTSGRYASSYRTSDSFDDPYAGRSRYSRDASRSASAHSESRNSARMQNASQPVRRSQNSQNYRRQSSSGRSSQSSRASQPISRGRSMEMSQTRRRDAQRGSHSSGRSKPQSSILEKILSSKPVMILIVLLVIVLAGFTWDTASNWNRAYAGISINGVSVSGMDSAQMNEALRNEFGPKVSHTQVTVYGSEEDKRLTEQAMSQAGDIGTDGTSAESVNTAHWTTDALSLKATIPYEQAIEEALALGREEGGFFKRIEMIADPVDISLGVDFDLDAIDAFASQIDSAIGDPRKDATVSIVDAYAYPIEGHDGTMVDRFWLAEKLSHAMIDEGSDPSFVAELVDAPSRITNEQVAILVDQLNHALGCDARFYYKDNSYEASDIDLGDWTVVNTVPDGSGYKLEPSINASTAMPAIAKGAKAYVTGDDTTVRFERTSSDIMVYTGGTGMIPELGPAVEELNSALYGPDGIAWSNAQPYTIQVDIGETDKPESLTLSQAIDSEIVTVIGEYTTTFADYVGTENRNHNIKLAADLLNDSIVGADGGIWSFNDTTGNTNEEAGFWAAGSIIEGEIVDSIGGGICQVATTVFNAAYEAGLDIVERHNHSIDTRDYPDGRDAAVTYPEMDLVWKNTLPSDILVAMSYTDTSVTCKLYSVYTGYTVETTVGERKEGKKYSIRFKEDETYATGAYVKKSDGQDGSEIEVTRTVKDKDGKTITFNSFHSVYDPKDEIYTVGPDTDTDKLKEEFEKERAEKEKAKKAEEEASEDESGGSSDDAE